MTMTLEQLLARDGKLIYKISGISMEPMLRQNRDLVMIRVPEERLKKYDVALYKRGASYVLHRVIAVREDHYLITNGLRSASLKAPDGQTDFPVQMAAVTLVSIPLFLVFVFLRKYIMSGVSRSGIKG